MNMSDPNAPGGNFVDQEGGLFLWSHELAKGLRQKTSHDGEAGKLASSVADQGLDQESFLPEEERALPGGAGAGPRDPQDSVNDA